jgi:hypothetical protein
VIRILTFALYLSYIIYIKMKKNKIDQHSQPSDSKSNQPAAGKEIEKPFKKTRYPLPIKPEKIIPVKDDLDNRRSIQNRPHQH